MENIKRFVKTPEIGAIVKVYIEDDKKHRFGKVKDITIVDMDDYTREIIVLEPCKPVEFWEIDYFFDISKVSFEKS